MTDIRTFRAASMQQALQLVRTHLGPQAAVLHTRQVNRGMLGWLVGKQHIEVTASNEFRVPSRLGPAAPVQERSATPSSATPSSATPSFASHQSARVGPQTDIGLQSQTGAAMQRQLQNLQTMVEQLLSDRDVSESPTPAVQAAVERLVALDFPPAEVERLIESLSATWLEYGAAADAEEVWDSVHRFIHEQINIQPPTDATSDRPRIVALVGPTGVGKTTTIAKLAANQHLHEQRSVGLITVDTYRIAAVEQLRTYAEIIDLPMEVVSNAAEMRAAIEKLSHVDLILIDTAGRSPRDDIRIRELRAVVQEANPDEVHLVVSAVAGATSLSGTVETFRQVGITSLLITKLDEAPTLGSLWPVLQQGIPLSYVTDGQKVPDDIRTAAADVFTAEILGRVTEVES